MCRPSPSTAQLVRSLHALRLLAPEQTTELRERLGPRFHDIRALGRELLSRDWLTPFQINRLHQGRRLVLGPYLLLGRLGEGGMGQVYKARHRHMNRVVALKVIRRSRLSE